jgi:hypothetical protein
MLRSKMVIIRKKSSEGNPCKVEACIYKGDDGIIKLYIRNLFLYDEPSYKAELLKTFKGKYLYGDSIAFRLETFNELLDKLNDL